MKFDIISIKQPTSIVYLFFLICAEIALGIERELKRSRAELLEADIILYKIYACKRMGIGKFYALSIKLSGNLFDSLKEQSTRIYIFCDFF